MTLAEKQCILAERTCNPSFNSFAAEVIYHAEETNTKWDIVYESAIVAEMTVVKGIKESYLNTHKFKAYNSEYVRIVRSIKGDW